MIRVYFSFCLLLLLCSCKNSPTEHKAPAIPDSTSNNFVWTIDTLGSGGSLFTDCWGSGPGSVYATGFIYDPEPGNYGTCVMHWDGTRWKPMNLIADMNAIFGFSDNDIWVGGSDGIWANPHAVTHHWDGSSWNKDSIGLPFAISRIWGTSSKSIYAVGNKGFIIKNNGSGWKQMQSNTQEYLMDIWGTSDTDIYASGGNDDMGTGILLHYNGKIWSTIYDQNAVTNGDNPVGELRGIWGYDHDNYIISPWSGTFQGANKNWMQLYPPKDKVFIDAIRGTSANNYFLLGDFRLIIHWNGKRWKRFDEFYRHPPYDNLYTLAVFDNEVFIFGGTSQGIGIKGIVYHGVMVY